jgi:uncharacterized membrane protein YhaH (DUF805 family)
MNELPQDSEIQSLEDERDEALESAQSRGHRWFYSHEGERIGPVTFADLQIKAKEGGLNPRLDLVWKHGMDEWQPSGEIPGLFERRETEKREDLAPPTDPYAPPELESVEERMSREGDWPGARRRSYLAATLLFPFAWAFGFAMATPFLTTQFGPEIMKFAAIGIQLVPVVVSIYFAVRRLINVGMSGWWWFGSFVPLLNVWIGYRCFACPAGYAYHKKLDGIGIFLAIIYWLMVVILIATVAAGIALLLGSIGSPELQQQIRDVIQQAMRPTTKP